MADARQILVIEDDPGIARELVRGLTAAGYECELCVDGRSGIEHMLGDEFDMVILDMMLPECDGYDVLEARHERSSVPVLILTAHTALDSRLRCFELGAIDWMSKPFFMQELLARIRARLNQPPAPARAAVSWANAELDLHRRVVRLDSQDAELTAHEFNLLASLVKNPGRVMSRRQLGEAALPVDGERNDRTINSHIARIRKKLGPAGEALRTIRGAGYCFEPSDDGGS